MNTDFDHITNLLDRWYAGETSPAQEAELRAFFSAPRPLPPRLEKERLIFNSLADADSPDLTLPDEISAAIDTALSKEISIAPTVVHKRNWRRIAVFLSGVAAACVILVSILLFSPSVTSPVREVAMAPISSAVSGVQPVQSDSVSPAPESHPTVLAPEVVSESRIAHRRAVHRVRTPQVADLEAPEAPEVSDCDEVPAGYIAVTDKLEAMAILNSIFMCLEGRMTREECRLDNLAIALSAGQSDESSESIF